MRARYVALLRLLKQGGAARMTTREQNAHMDDLESLLLWLVRITGTACDLAIQTSCACACTSMQITSAHCGAAGRPETGRARGTP